MKNPEMNKALFAAGTIVAFALHTTRKGYIRQ
jgi:hypothetical protein